MRREDAIYKRVPGCDIGATLYETAKRPKAAVLWIHGGALIMGGRQDIETAYAHELEFLLESGFVVVSIDYRLAPESVLPDILEDVLDAYRWIRSGCGGRLEHAPEKICLVGHSAGGYLSQWLGAVVEDKPAAVVSFYGYGDILGDWYGKPSSFYCGLGEISPADANAHVRLQPVISNCSGELSGLRCAFYYHLRQKGTWAQTVSGLAPEGRDLAVLKGFCPLEMARPDFPPTFFAHGTEDADVPFLQSELMKARLDELGVPSCLWPIEKGGHCFGLNKQWRSSEESAALTSALSHFWETHVV